jgi:hypothetical protein
MVRDFSHRNVKISHRTGIGANFSHRMGIGTNFSHRKGKHFHSAVIVTVWELACYTLLEDLQYDERF